MEQKDEGKIIICGSTEKKFKRKFGDGSDDSGGDDDGFKSKGKNFKLTKSRSKSAHCPRKVKR